MKARNLGSIAAMALAACILDAAAVEWNFYGSARVKTWYEFKDAADGKSFADGDDKDADLDFALQANSRAGAKVKVNDELSGLAEVAFTESNINIRHLLGSWNFGPGTLSIGQTYTPISRYDSLRAWSDDAGLQSFGEPYLGRRPLIQLQMKGLKLALVKPHTITNLYASNTNLTSEVDNLLPRIEASFQHKVGMFAFDLVGGFHSYEVATPDEDLDVHSYLAGAGFWLKPDPAYLRAIGYYSRNARQFGQFISPQPVSFGSAKIADGEVVDNDVLAAAVFGGYKFSEKIAAEIGYGYSQSEDDLSGAKADKWQSYYAQVAFTVFKGISITPEVGVAENVGTHQRTAYVGAKWQANF